VGDAHQLGQAFVASAHLMSQRPRRCVLKTWDLRNRLLKSVFYDFCVNMKILYNNWFSEVLR